MVLEVDSTESDQMDLILHVLQGSAQASYHFFFIIVIMGLILGPARLQSERRKELFRM